MCHRNFYEGKWAGRGHWHRGRRGGRWGAFSGPPANVQELDDRYELQLLAPGRTKEDFRIRVKDDVLTIAYRRPDQEIVEESNWTRREFDLVSFERRFQLNDKIDPSGINARYEAGILAVALPKLPEWSGPATDVEIV